MWSGHSSVKDIDSTVTKWFTQGYRCGGNNEGRPPQASERYVPPQCAMEKVLYGSIFGMIISPLLTTDSAVTSETVNSRWNSGDRYGLGNFYFSMLQSEQYEKQWHYDSDGNQVYTMLCIMWLIDGTYDGRRQVDDVKLVWLDVSCVLCHLQVHCTQLCICDLQKQFSPFWPTAGANDATHPTTHGDVRRRRGAVRGGHHAPRDNSSRRYTGWNRREHQLQRLRGQTCKLG